MKHEMKYLHTFENFLNEAKETIIDYSNSRNKILVGEKTNLLRDMKERYDYKEEGDTIYFFDKGNKHFGTLFDLGTRYQELRHNGKLDEYGWLKESYVDESKSSKSDIIKNFIKTYAEDEMEMSDMESEINDIYKMARLRKPDFVKKLSFEYGKAKKPEVEDFYDSLKESRVNEAKGSLKVEKEKDGKYYWTFTFKSGKVEKWPNGFATSAEAQKDFMYRSKFLKESLVTEAKSKLFAALEKSGKLTQPTGGASMNGKYYQLEGGSKYDVIHFDYDPKSNKPFGVAQVAGHHMPMQILNKLGFRETRSWTAGVEVYIFDGNYNPKSMTEDEMSELVDGWSKGFGSYAKSISDFYKKRGKTSGTID